MESAVAAETPRMWIEFFKKIKKKKKKVNNKTKGKEKFGDLCQIVLFEFSRV